MDNKNKNRQEWTIKTKIDKNRQEWTRMDKNGQEWTRMDKNIIYLYIYYM